MNIDKKKLTKLIYYQTSLVNKNNNNNKLDYETNKKGVNLRATDWRNPGYKLQGLRYLLLIWFYSLVALPLMVPHGGQCVSSGEDISIIIHLHILITTSIIQWFALVTKQSELPYVINILLINILIRKIFY